MFNSTASRRVLQSAVACLLTAAALASPARAGDAASSPAAAVGSAPGVPASMIGALAPGQWHSEPLREAVEGAAMRLASPSCAAVLEDFTDPLGRTLLERLDELGSTPSEHARAVLFYSGFDEPACRQNRRAFAFTVPGCPVVRVCRPLPILARTRPELAQAVVIHEVLHTLGLGENPPSSPEITARVVRRCFADRS